MNKLKENQDIEADDFNTIKSIMLENLQATLKKIEEMQPINTTNNHN